MNVRVGLRDYREIAIELGVQATERYILTKAVSSLRVPCDDLADQLTEDYRP